MNFGNNQKIEPVTLISEIELRHLNFLGELINYGASKMQEVDNTKLGHHQSFLAFNHAAVNNYSEAIYTLCKDARPHACFVLLRSLYEAHINSEYVKLGDIEKKLALYAREGLSIRKTVANEFGAFIKKYPTKRDSLEVLEETNIESLKDFAEESINAINRANKLEENDYYPDLLTKSREIDKNATGKDIGEAELYYHLVYRYLSPYAHLSAWGLEFFTQKTPDGIISFDLGQSKKIHLIITQTYLYYFSSLQDLFKYKVLNGELATKYLTDHEEIKNSKPT